MKEVFGAHVPIKTVGECITLDDLLNLSNRDAGYHISYLYDYVTGGAYKGQTHLFCASSGVGKTRMGIHVACELIKQELKVAYCTFEQTETEIYYMVCQHFHDDVSIAYEFIQSKYLYVHRFDTDTVNNMTQVVNSLSEYDAIIWDYITAPDNCNTDAYGAGASAVQLMAALKHSSEVNNQFIFVLAQSRYVENEKKKLAFSSSNEIYLSTQLYKSVDVCAICKSLGQNIQVVDFIKVRYPFNGIGRSRITRCFDYKHCNIVADDSLEDDNGTKFNLEGLKQV